MWKPISARGALAGGGLVVLLAGSFGLVSGTKPPFNKHQKAFYADQALVAFVRPGLVVTIKSAQIASDGTIKADFTLTDPNGLPLDRAGVFTPGAVSTSFIAAFIPNGQEQYTAYTTKSQTSPITNVSATQAGTDSGGTYAQVGDGEYTYTFHTKAPSNIDRTATHSIGVYSSRDLTQFNLGTSFSDNVYAFVPNGSALKVTRDVVKTTACNKCHDPLSAHGGARQSVELCVLCHTPQTVDPDTGNTVDFKVMVHKIHMGSSLPSVNGYTANGQTVPPTPYQIIGYKQSVNDFSTVVFPADVRRCEVCHDQNLNAAQSTAYLTHPTRDACGSCHDNVNFASGVNHSGSQLPEVSDHECATCHTPQGELEFDASIKGAHTIAEFSTQLPGTVFNLIRVDNGAAGKSPTVTFSIQNKAGQAILPSEMARLSLVLAGPTNDYSTSVSEDATKATVNNDGTYSYTFKAAVPTGATGSYSVGIEGYCNETINPGTTQSQVVRDAGVNQVINFSADGSPVAPRRAVVAIESCNVCHASLSVHGGNRNQVVQCVLCHNPNATDAAMRPASANPPQGIDFRSMIHKIHTGNNLTIDFTVYGYHGSVNNFNNVRFPGDRRDCEKCHVAGTEELPLADNLLSVANPRGYIDPTPPTTAACIGCHTDKSAASHALANTTALGEACAVCHGTDAQFSIDQVHAR